MSIFAQYVPYQLASGSWDDRREAIADAAIAAIARFAPDIGECIVHRQVLGPPDIEARIGLTGGHIFQGECLPDQMWNRRFSPRTPIPGLYLCGAATHPGGSVIAVNGRNAAMAVLEDAESKAQLDAKSIERSPRPILAVRRCRTNVSYFLSSCRIDCRKGPVRRAKLEPLIGRLESPEEQWEP